LGREEVVLPIEDLEAIKLIGFQRMDQETAARIMYVSCQTFGRIPTEVRAIVVEAQVMGNL
jgi:predicted DNA-binding protein (UPF0251 family)